jgi:hypothetical protein
MRPYTSSSQPKRPSADTVRMPIVIWVGRAEVIMGLAMLGPSGRLGAWVSLW